MSAGTVRWTLAGCCFGAVVAAGQSEQWAAAVLALAVCLLIIVAKP